MFSENHEWSSCSSIMDNPTRRCPLKPPWLFFVISLILVFKYLLVPCEADGLYSMFIVSFTFKHFRTSESSFTRIHKPFDKMVIGSLFFHVFNLWLLKCKLCPFERSIWAGCNLFIQRVDQTSLSRHYCLKTALKHLGNMFIDRLKFSTNRAKVILKLFFGKCKFLANNLYTVSWHGFCVFKT